MRAPSLPLQCVSSAFLVCTLLPAAAVGQECPLAPPGPLVTADNPQVKRHSFSLVGERTSEEVIVLASGFTLRLAVKGCEYNVLIIRFESKGAAIASGNSAGAYRAAAEALAAFAAAKPSTVFNLSMASQVIHSTALHGTQPKRGSQIPISPASDPVPYVSVTGWGGTSQGVRFVQVELSRGPV